MAEPTKKAKRLAGKTASGPFSVSLNMGCLKPDNIKKNKRFSLHKEYGSFKNCRILFHPLLSVITKKDHRLFAVKLFFFFQKCTICCWKSFSVMAGNTGNRQ